MDKWNNNEKDIQSYFISLPHYKLNNKMIKWIKIYQTVRNSSKKIMSWKSFNSRIIIFWLIKTCDIKKMKLIPKVVKFQSFLFQLGSRFLSRLIHLSHLWRISSLGLFKILPDSAKHIFSNGDRNHVFSSNFEIMHQSLNCHSFNSFFSD